MAIGAETRGVVLLRPGGEVELHGVKNPQAHAGKKVEVVGRWRTHDYVERGPTRVFQVETIRPLE